ncbi:hypothetical protein EPUL_001927, partial [Erysiphe pulchra]
MSYLPARLASQLLNFINSGHIYTDEVNRETFEEIEAAAEKEPEETLPGNITRRKGKAGRSVGPQYLKEWAKSKESFRKAILKFQAGNSLRSPDEYLPTIPSKSNSPTPINNKRTSIIENSENVSKYQRSNMTRAHRPIENTYMYTVPKDITSLFNGIEKLDDSNWSIWKGHMQDNLDLCDLWEIVIGEESRPDDKDVEELRLWMRREKIARTIIKNALGTKDYSQVQFTRNVAEIWRKLITLHQSTGAQGKTDLIWKFWSMRCEEEASVRIHVGEVRALHLELAELGIIAAFQASHMALAKDPFSENCDITTTMWPHDIWIADSGFSFHIANRREMFAKFTPSNGFLNVAGGLTTIIEDKDGGRLAYGDKSCQFYNKNGNLYKVGVKALIKSENVANLVAAQVFSWNQAHRLLGYVPLTSLKLLFKKDHIKGIRINESEPVPKELSCESCIAAKSHILPFPLKATKRSKKFGNYFNCVIG